MLRNYTVTIPEWESSYQKSAKRMPKYWVWTDREKLPKKHKDNLRTTPLVMGSKLYCCDGDGERFIKNTKTVGKPNLWVMNGQDLYNATLNWRLRKTVAKYYHEYFAPEGKFLSISCDIYEIHRKIMPDVSNMWLLEKFFEDALQECGVIPGDDPDYVMESGRKRYHWVNNEEDRKLIFSIKLI